MSVTLVLLIVNLTVILLYHPTVKVATANFKSKYSGVPWLNIGNVSVIYAFRAYTIFDSITVMLNFYTHVN